MKMNVYVCTCGPFSKIGISQDIKTRMSNLRNSNPYPVELRYAVGFLDRYDAAKVEHATHQILEERYERVSGEWFRISPEAAVLQIHYCAYLLQIEPRPDRSIDPGFAFVDSISVSGRGSGNVWMRFPHEGQILLSRVWSYYKGDSRFTTQFDIVNTALDMAFRLMNKKLETITKRASK
jgi:hypothetical protein